VSTPQYLNTLLRSKWDNLLESTTLAISEPGFIGPIPYLLLLRWLILTGILLRFWLHKDEYTGSQWLLILLLSGLTIILAFISTYVTTQPGLRGSKRIQGLFIASDILLISIFYLLTNNIQSSFFLFYYLPIFAATEYLGGKAMLTISAIITGAFASVLAWLFLIGTDPTLTLTSLLLGVFLPREVFFLSVVMTSSLLLQLERSKREKISQREAEIQTLLDFKAEVDQLFDENQVLQLTIRKAVSIVGAEGGHISLVDFETGELKPRVHTPQDYFQEHGVTVDNGIAEQVVRHGQPYLLENVQSHLSLREIFAPNTQVLLYVPIMTHNTVLGVLSVGGVTKSRFGGDAERFLQSLSGQAATTIERVRLLVALHEIGIATASVLELDFELDLILQELTERLGFEFATVSLVDDYRQIIEIIRGKNVPSGWMGRSKYNLDHSDLQAEIIHSGKTEVLEGWDERFDREIYERFGYTNFVRIFAPLVADGVNIGTIEAGCRRERRSEVLTLENIRIVEQLGQERGTVIAPIRSHVLLEMIASRAIEIIGADSASIHVYQFDQLLLEAGAGRATKVFLHKFPPRESGIGRRAMQIGKPIVIDEPLALMAEHKTLYDEGIWAIAAFPLSLGAGVQGVLYIHFWHEHLFSRV
jgi:GAF domain-containing protein